jgi:hypothetical protein
MTVEPMPAAFSGHRSSMNALERNSYTHAASRLHFLIPISFHPMTPTHSG